MKFSIYLNRRFFRNVHWYSITESLNTLKHIDGEKRLWSDGAASQIDPIFTLRMTTRLCITWYHFIFGFVKRKCLRAYVNSADPVHLCCGTRSSGLCCHLTYSIVSKDSGSGKRKPGWNCTVPHADRSSRYSQMPLKLKFVWIGQRIIQ